MVKYNSAFARSLINNKELYMRDLETFYGPNAGYVQELYERYLQNPANVDLQTRAVFDSWSQDHEAPLVEGTGRTDGHVPFQVSDVVAASALTHAIRERGHLGAHLDPLGTEPLGDPALLPETHGITNEDLALLPPTIVICSLLANAFYSNAFY